ncbi:hypothetical protein F751_4232 [Auxenochlorella protothecoides]|uniref:Uncharacterized protein n=1 Tax=Auxenochlorella protothecoides TaxID=3075 RepID=A0A087SA34_AUXPR|nr:hypothetical protein F751_4232 [Auxenochlorella protothecoides]KFM22588.1 hypothetical protein F751_4232 [Auxenochlorella protothecoides]
MHGAMGHLNLAQHSSAQDALGTLERCSILCTPPLHHQNTTATHPRGMHHHRTHPRTPSAARGVRPAAAAAPGRPHRRHPWYCPGRCLRRPPRRPAPRSGTAPGSRARGRPGRGSRHTHPSAGAAGPAGCRAACTARHHTAQPRPAASPAARTPPS